MKLQVKIETEKDWINVPDEYLLQFSKVELTELMNHDVMYSLKANCFIRLVG